MRTRAKFLITDVEIGGPGNQLVKAIPVSDKPFDANGVSEDNDFAKWTPSGKLELHIANPALDGVFKAGQKYYVDLTESAD